MQSEKNKVSAEKTSNQDKLLHDRDYLNIDKLLSEEEQNSDVLEYDLKQTQNINNQLSEDEKVMKISRKGDSSDEQHLE